MKPKKNRARPAVLSAALILLGVLIVGSTVAYLLDRTGTITNRFVAGDIKINVSEQTATQQGATEPDIKKNVQIKNIGQLPVRVRAKLVITWKNAEGEVWAELPEEDEDFVLEFADGEPGTKWHDLGGLVYLYHLILKQKDYTIPLIESCRPIGNRAPEGYHLSVDILAQAIQAEPLSEISSYLTPETTAG